MAKKQPAEKSATKAPKSTTQKKQPEVVEEVEYHAVFKEQKTLKAMSDADLVKLVDKFIKQRMILAKPTCHANTLPSKFTISKPKGVSALTD